MNRTSGQVPADLLVIGAGMAGLTAGAWAARNGARVVVAEHAPALGGSAARWTLLATGGFQADPELRGEHIHPQARGIALRSNPYSAGDGLRLGLSAGGMFGQAGAGFYGHLVPVGVPLADPALFTELALYYSEHGLLFNVNGERFTDETAADHLTTMALVGQPEARGLLVGDAVTYREWITGSYVEGIPAANTFEACRRRGARCLPTP